MKKSANITKKLVKTSEEVVDMKPQKNQAHSNAESDNAFNFVDNEIAIIMDSGKLTKN